MPPEENFPFTFLPPSSVLRSEHWVRYRAAVSVSLKDVLAGWILADTAARGQVLWWNRGLHTRTTSQFLCQTCKDHIWILGGILSSCAEGTTCTMRGIRNAVSDSEQPISWMFLLKEIILEQFIHQWDAIIYTWDLSCFEVLWQLQVNYSTQTRHLSGFNPPQHPVVSSSVLQYVSSS